MRLLVAFIPAIALLLASTTARAETFKWTGKTRVSGWIFKTKECEYSNGAIFSDAKIVWLEADNSGNCPSSRDI